MFLMESTGEENIVQFLKVKSLREEDPVFFKKYMRMSPAEFSILKSKVKPYLTKKPAGRKALSVGHRLSMTVR